MHSVYSNYMRINICIDGNNLYKSAKSLGYIIDYKKTQRLAKTKVSATRRIYIYRINT